MEELLFVVAAVLGMLPVASLLLSWGNSNELRKLRERLDETEMKLAALGRTAATTAPPLPPAPSPAATLAPSPPPPPPVRIPEPAIPPRPDLIASPAPPQPTPPPAPPPITSTRRPALDASRLEELVGGIWLQNAGSVLFLLGSFFLILWGYTRGKFGPEVLVGAGVVLGALLAWRGDRIARTVRPWGHALLGVGLGVIYITIFLGHFRMNVLSAPVAFALLALHSFLTVDIGLRRRQAIIAALGVLGAFLPLMLSQSTGAAFHLGHAERLGYLAIANAVVFVLAMARGWTGLVLEAILGTALAWAVDAEGSLWSLPVQIGLCLLYTSLGFALVMRLFRSPAPVGRIEIATISLAPMVLLAQSLPYFEVAPAATSGALLAGLGVLHLAAAFWVDAKRAERDVWRPLTAAGILFLTAAVERFLDAEHLALAWGVEGALLVWVGLAPRGGWFRLLGYSVSALAFLRLLTATANFDPAAHAGLGFLSAPAIRDLLVTAVLLVVADRILRRSDRLSERERFVPAFWIAAAHLALVRWILLESPHAAAGLRLEGASDALASFGFAVQAAALLHGSGAHRNPAPRYVAYGVAVCAFYAFVSSPIDGPPWREGDLPVLHPVGVVLLLTLGVFAAITRWLERRREHLGAQERAMADVAFILGNLLLMSWTAREATRTANALHAPEALQAVLASFWSLQALALLHLRSAREREVRRWVGYVVGAAAWMTFVTVPLSAGLLAPGALPVLYPRGLFLLLATAALVWAAVRLRRVRALLGTRERLLPEATALAANVAALLWTAREAGRTAKILMPGAALAPGDGSPTAMLAAVLTSGAWIAQAGVLLVIGWVRRSAFFRWSGLALVGLTTLKVVFFDLARVDVFWRFVTALGVGAAMLIVSFAYQRGKKERDGATP